jgi:hypothetical protein
VRNRDTHGWVLDRAEIKLPPPAEGSEVRVLDTLAAQASLAPDQEEQVVVIFSAPATASGQRYDVQLLEKAGSRHARLEGLAL